MSIEETMKPRPDRKGRKIFLTILLTLLGLCLLLSIISGLSNIGLPQPETSDRLSELDKARLAEALHLKAKLGDRVWPGWGATRNPVVIWNRAWEFLVDYPGQPPAGWETVPEDTFFGQPYYRRTALDPQNFAYLVGDYWTGNMATKTDADAFLIDTFRNMFPTPLKQLFPYRLFIQPSETQIGGTLHEDFHAYQMQVALQRMGTAEAAHSSGDRYESALEAFQVELKQEYALLARALEAKSDLEAADLVRQFLQVRDDRRRTYQLDPDLITYERWLEWEEGVAKYVEVDSLRLAFQSVGYFPLPAMADDPIFYSYQRFNSRWSQELFQLRNPSGSLDTRFYMSGMAESFLLDRLMPDWKSKVMDQDVFLEDLLRQAVSGK
jgi:hypothetical protein